MICRPGLFLLVLPLWGQTQAPLQLRVIDGEGVVYTIGSRATRGVTVEVTDPSGKPLPGVIVRFELPTSGPTGTFGSGGQNLSATTGPDGRAEAWGMQWNRVAGPIDLRIAATFGASTVTTRVALSLTRAAEVVDRAPVSVGKSHKKLWIALAVAGGAVVAVAGLAGKTAPSFGSPVPTNGPQIGAPTITIGAP